MLAPGFLRMISGAMEVYVMDQAYGVGGYSLLWLFMHLGKEQFVDLGLNLGTGVF